MRRTIECCDAQSTVYMYHTHFVVPSIPILTHPLFIYRFRRVLLVVVIDPSFLLPTNLPLGDLFCGYAAALS